MPDSEVEEIERRLQADPIKVFQHYLPGGHKDGDHWICGGWNGDPGKSLKIRMDGVGSDFATGESSGKLLSVISRAKGLNDQKDFPKVLDEACDLLGIPKKTNGKKQKKPRWCGKKPSIVYNYHDRHGNVTAWVHRYNFEDGTKDCIPGHYKNYQPVNKRPNPAPVYNQHNICDSETVFWVEGEKAAQALIDKGVPATCTMSGSGLTKKLHLVDWKPLAGKHVIIWPDADEPGDKYAKAVAKALLENGAASVKIMLIPACYTNGWDAADAIDEGIDVKKFIKETARKDFKAEDFVDEKKEEKKSDPQDQEKFRGFGTSSDIAAEFINKGLEGSIFNHTIGSWYWFFGYWRKDETELTIQKLWDIGQEQDFEGGYSAIKGAERLARGALAATHKKFDQSPMLLGCGDKTVDLKTGKVIKSRSSDFITKLTAGKPDFESECFLWRRFLDEATNGDRKLQAFLQRIAGYCLTGSVKEHALFFVYGAGGNGKSVFVNVLTGIMGSYAKPAAMDTFQASKNDRHPTDLAMLAGARLVTASETDEGRAWDEARVKQMTGGDPIIARFMRQDFFTYQPQFKLLVIGNHKPTLRNVDEAMRRRFNIIPFLHKPETPDKDLEAKLKDEWPAILAWMIEGCLEWQRIGLARPAIVEKETDGYFSDQDILGQWLEDKCGIGSQMSEQVGKLYASWKLYAEESGIPAGTIKKFADQLQKRGFEGGKFQGARVRFGLELKV